MPGVHVVPLGRDGVVALIDSADAQAVGERYWHVCPNPLHPYAQSNVKLGVNRWTAITLHRFLWDLHRGAETPMVDHENRDGLDCRFSNLRAATRAQNQWNAAAPHDNRSGVKGVSLDAHGVWVARIRANNRCIHLGRFKTRDEAARAREQAAYDFHGEFARVA